MDDHDARLNKIFESLSYIFESLSISHEEVKARLDQAVQKRMMGTVKQQSVGTDLFAQAIKMWRENPDFVGSDGEPKLLSLDGPRPSLANLLEQTRKQWPERYSTVDVDRFVAGLLDFTLVEKTSEELYKLGRSYVPLKSGGSQDQVAILRTVCDFLGTLSENLASESSENLFQRTTWCFNYDEAKLGLLIADLEDKGMKLLTEFDESMGANRVNGGDHSTYVGVGVYMFKEAGGAATAGHKFAVLPSGGIDSD